MGAGPTRQMNGAGNGRDTPVVFKLSDAERIASVVNTVENGRRDRRGSTLPRAAGGGGSAIYTAAFAGNWPAGSEKVLSIAGSTATVKNISQGILYSATSRVCFVTMIDSQYVMISAGCE